MNPYPLKPVTEITEDLIEDIRVILSDDTIIKYLPFKTSPDNNAVKEFLNKIVVPGNFVWGINSQNRVEGIIDLIRIDDDTFSLAYFLSSSLQGRGIITSSIKMVTEYAFQQCGISKIIAPVVSRNKGSIRVLEKSGFQLDPFTYRTVNFDGSEDEVYQFKRYR